MLIQIAHSLKDDEFARELASSVATSDVTSLMFINMDEPSWFSRATGSLSETTFVLVVLSEHTADHDWAGRLDRLMDAVVMSSAKTIPVFVGHVTNLPAGLRDLRFVRTDRSKPGDAAKVILRAFGAAEAYAEKQEIRRQTVRADVSEFVEDAIKTQKEAERKNRRLAHAWYLFGVISLGAVLALTYLLLVRAINGPSNEAASTVVRAVAVVVLNLVVVGVFAALARYSYSLGKSYMTEALKSADRIHAIQFGKFYLKAYGDRLTPTEVKDAFQHWNIDRTSTFASLDSSQIDPQILSVVTQLATAITGKKKNE
ncbi:hypothetical protein CN230_25035 [Sinorhizobium meliloti]|uniref:hypothetical protein n=1 Tax=Rhizobium meliloti TaxID=382 RepID=UPI000FDB8687|nr:hypothetical protein [Sinorhizobium meliloti]RVG06661.1 hypothetical protein CN230_25035 [Sinorhizobium meliloti]